MELKKQKNKNQETDGFESDKRPRTDKVKPFILIYLFKLTI